jgi:uncharacterized protein (DUF1501 family)
MNATRRDFLKSAIGTSTLVSLAPAIPAFLGRTARAAAGNQDRDTVLVVVQLSGGNDGLNTVVPYADDAYGRARNTLRLTERDVHKIDDYLGFHPDTPAFARLLNDGRMGVIQGVGYPASNRSHDGALRDWHTAEPGNEQCPTGWLGRAIDCMSPSDEPNVPGISVAPIPKQFVLNAKRSVVPAIRSAGEAVLKAPAGQSSRVHRQQLVKTAEPHRADTDNPLLDFARTSTLAAGVASRDIEAVLDQNGVGSDYPPYQLAGSLRSIAQLIRADVGMRIFFTELGGGGIGGFDNHAGQRDNHAALLKQLSRSLAAFADDLARDNQFDRVALMTFSEFGRTLSENGRRGTGHGEAQPIFLLGGRVRGGLIGKHPSLTDLNQDAPKHHTDFRSVFATMLDNWLGLDSEPVLGRRYAPLDVFDA